MPWAVVDYRVFRLNGVMAGQDPPVGVLQLPPVSGGQLWRLERASVQVAYDPIAPVVPVYVDLFDMVPNSATVAADATTLSPSSPVFGSAPPFFDAADNASPVTVTEGNQLTLVFTAPNGNFPVGNTVVAARLQVSILAGYPGQPTPVAGSIPGPLS